MGFCVLILEIFTHPPCFLAFSENEIKTVLVVLFWFVRFPFTS